MARMALSHKAPHARFHFRETPRWPRLARKHALVDFRRTDAARTPHHDLPVLFAPLKKGTRPNAKLLPNFRWD
jgi:hypothetical protein